MRSLPMGKPVLGLASSSHCGFIGCKKIQIYSSVFYIVGTEIGKKLVYESQICTQKMCILTCAHKISCRAFKFVISARFSAQEIKFSNRKGSISEHFITLQALKLSTVSPSSSPLFPCFCKWGTEPVPVI
jgi:hypothetical protein